jgi:uncharacterized membrane protein YcaP (DUF421 family)
VGGRVHGQRPLAAKPVDRNLRAQRLNIDDLAEEARTNGIESLDDIKWCVLESSGSMSFIKAT